MQYALKPLMAPIAMESACYDLVNTNSMQDRCERKKQTTEIIIKDIKVSSE